MDYLEQFLRDNGSISFLPLYKETMTDFIEYMTRERDVILGVRWDEDTWVLWPLCDVA